MRKGLFNLIETALRIKLEERGMRFGLCSIMNVKSGHCTEDCSFCAQSSRYKTRTPVFSLRSRDEICRHAERAKEIGAERFSLVSSGRGPSPKELDQILEAVSFVKRRVDIGLCASLGIMEEKALRLLKDAGLTRYHHNLETSRGFFKKVCTTHSFEDRVKTIENARKAGLECCSGCIIGMGETREDREDIARTLKGLGVDSVPINILVPIEGTPLWGHGRRIDLPGVIETIAIFRTILKTPAIRLCGGREQALGDFQGLAFMAGADAMIIGGYLTTPGRDPELDLRLKEECVELWQRMDSSRYETI